MNMFSLRTIIDDILLIVRNNNISESEDLSRDLIAAWVMLYRAYLAKKQAEKDKETGDDIDPDDSLNSTVGPLELIDSPNPGEDECCNYTFKRTKNKVKTAENSADDIVSVTDNMGCTIQYMNNQRKHFHRFRRYTFNEPTCWFDDGYIYVEGSDLNTINTVYITGNMDPINNADNEDDVNIPGWMVPDIKKAIMTNELSFMLKRPSDDSNNSTLASVKPNGPQDKEE